MLVAQRLTQLLLQSNVRNGRQACLPFIISWRFQSGEQLEQNPIFQWPLRQRQNPPSNYNGWENDTIKRTSLYDLPHK